MLGRASRLLTDTLGAAWRALGFDQVADEAFFQLVVARLVEPTSMSAAARVLGDPGLAPARLEHSVTSGDIAGQTITAQPNVADHLQEVIAGVTH
ncbi:MAG: hypothetical protein LBU50_07615 [Cellulomonas sp.]|nr:hypothetical protein [Cellulomonas sp.]